MHKKIKDFLEMALFSALTLSIYTLFIFTIPISAESHGWIALNGFDNPLWIGGIDGLIFGSALACALLGSLMMAWVPALSPSVVRNLWGLTYVYIWSDSIISLSLGYQTIGFLLRLSLGLIFIILFFHVLQYLGFKSEQAVARSDWRIHLIQYWTWGWMSFYFTLSFLLVYNSFKYSDLRTPLALGALCVCFLNYVFSLFLEKSEGKNVEQYSKVGRNVFLIWFLILLGCYVKQIWFF